MSEERPNIPNIYDNKLWIGLFTLNNKKYQIRSQSKSWTDAVYLKEAWNKLPKLKIKNGQKIYQANTLNKNVGLIMLLETKYISRQNDLNR